jgi:DNA-binding transcriptional MerR regulator
MVEPAGDPIAEVRYKAGDVCRMADVQPYVLRYWESEFSVLAPERGAPGPRLYTPRDVKIIERIKKLLYDEGYTIAGAKKRLEGELKSDGVTLIATPEPAAAPPPKPRRLTPVAEAPAVELPEPETGDAIADVDLASAHEPVRDAPIAPSSAQESKRRRVKTATPEPVPPPLFEAPAPPPVVEDRTVRLAARVDARLGPVVDELREILALLSREEP